MLECPDLADSADPRFYNDDIAPTPITRRTWDKWHIAALWVGMSVCVPTYMLASSLVQSGMDWKQAIGTVFLANFLVLIPMILNAHAGTKFGIPFPVYCRVAFGLVGANVPALMRGLVACGWFGIQTWIGGAAIYSILGTLGWVDVDHLGDHIGVLHRGKMLEYGNAEVIVNRPEHEYTRRLVSCSV